MTTLNTLTVCKEHTPHLSAISEVHDTQYTFCEVCEQNIDRFWLDDPDRLPMWSKWGVTR
jgi:hypothetical protein